MTAPDAATTAAAQLMKSELSDCTECGCRQMAGHLGALVVQEVRPVVEAEATARERQRIAERIKDARGWVDIDNLLVDLMAGES